jgi:hypothetical protein
VIDKPGANTLTARRGAVGSPWCQHKNPGGFHG